MHTTQTQAHSGHPVATVTIIPLASAGGLRIPNGQNSLSAGDQIVPQG
jgi:hypothetical protein